MYDYNALTTLYHFDPRLASGLRLLKSGKISLFGKDPHDPAAILSPDERRLGVQPSLDPRAEIGLLQEMGIGHPEDPHPGQHGVGLLVGCAMDGLLK